MLKLLSLYKIAAQLFGLKDVLPGAGGAETVDGKKTYLTAIALVLYAICGVICGMHDVDTAITVALNGLGLASLRHAIQKLIDLFRLRVPDPDPDPDEPLNVDQLISEAAAFRKTVPGPGETIYNPDEIEVFGSCGSCGDPAHVGACGVEASKSGGTVAH